MGHRSPLVTLAATAVGVVALLVVNSTQTDTSAPTVTATTAPPSATTPPTTPPTSASTTPTPTPSATPQITAVYAGRTNGREATLALAVKAGRAAAYVCDGRRVEAWLTGTQTGSAITLRSRAGDRLVATIAGNAVTGTVTVRGRPLRFTIGKAGPPAGLYRARTSSSTIGWIVLPDGSQVGIDNDGTPAPAPRLDPQSGVATVDGAAVTATSVAGDETF
jgi:hypothetical protein